MASWVQKLFRKRREHAEEAEGQKPLASFKTMVGFNDSLEVLRDRIVKTAEATPEAPFPDAAPALPSESLGAGLGNEALGSIASELSGALQVTVTEAAAARQASPPGSQAERGLAAPLEPRQLTVHTTTACEIGLALEAALHDVRQICREMERQK